MIIRPWERDKDRESEVQAFPGEDFDCFSGSEVLEFVIFNLENVEKNFLDEGMFPEGSFSCDSELDKLTSFERRAVDACDFRTKLFDGFSQLTRVH